MEENPLLKLEHLGQSIWMDFIRCGMIALGYLDAYRSAWLPANLNQDERDYFGAHL